MRVQYYSYLFIFPLLVFIPRSGSEATPCATKLITMRGMGSHILKAAVTYSSTSSLLIPILSEHLHSQHHSHSYLYHCQSLYSGTLITTITSIPSTQPSRLPPPLLPAQALRHHHFNSSSPPHHLDVKHSTPATQPHLSLSFDSAFRPPDWLAGWLTCWKDG